MDRLIAPNSVVSGSADTPPGSGTPQFATSGNPGTNTPATIFPAYQYNAIQEELIAIIAAGGLTPNRTVNTQVRDAILALIAAGGVGRTKLTTNTTFFVNVGSGSDSNNGLSSGTAWQTVQHALNVLASSYDLAGFTATIQLADGTYAGFSLNQPVPGAAGNSSVIINGNSGTPANVIISSAGTCAGGEGYTLQNMELTSSGGNCIVPAERGGISLGIGIIFGSAAASHILAGAAGATVDILNNYTIAGSAVNHLNAAAPGAWISHASGLTVILTGTPAFSTSFASASLAGALFIPGATYSGAATGVRYLATLNGVIDTNTANVNYFPGNSAGSTATGGQYA